MRMHRLLRRIVLRVGVFFIQGQLLGEAERATSGDDGDLVNRIRLREHLGDQRVARFVVGRRLFFFLADDHALALGSHQDLVFRILEVVHFHPVLAAPGCHERRFIHHVF